MKSFISSLAALLLVGALHAQQFDNPVTVPISYYGFAVKTIAAPYEASFHFGSELGTVTSGSSTGAPNTNFYSTPVTGYVVPGKDYTVTVTGGNVGVVVVYFQPVDGCAYYINGNRYSSFTNGINYSFRLRVERLKDLSQAMAGKRGGECSSFPEDKPIWYIGLGSTRYGKLAGALGIRASSITSALFSPSSLICGLVDAGEVSITRDGSGYITKVQSREVVLNVTTLSTTSYKIDACRPETPTTPFITYTVSQYGTTGIRIDKVEDGITWSTALQYANSIWTRYGWQKASVFPSTSDNITTTAVNGATSTVTYGSGTGSVVKQKNYTTVSGQTELASTVMGPGVTSAPTTSYSYYSSVYGAGWPQAVQWIIEPTGKWTKYDYFNGSTDSRSGQIQRIYRPWLDLPSAPSGATTSNCYVETFDYAANYDGTYSVPSSRVVTINNVTVGQSSWTYNWSYSTANAHTIAQTVEKDYSTSSSYLTTTTLSFLESDATTFFQGKPHSISHPDGTKESFAYYFGTWNSSTNTFTQSSTGDDRLILTFHGQATSGTGTTLVNSWTVGSAWTLDPIYLVNNLSTVTETVVDTHGRTVFNAENIYTGSGIERIAATAFTFNNSNLLQTAKDIIRSVPGGDVSLSYTYEAGLPKITTNLDGVSTTLGYDDLLRNTSVVTSGAGDYPSKTQSFTYYGSGQTHTAQDSSGSPTVKTYTYESTGRVASVTEPQPGSTSQLTTTMSYPSSVQTTETDPLNATRTTTLYLDGGLKSRSGTGQVPVQVGYSVGTGGVIVKTTQAGVSTANGWKEETSDWLGRTTKTRVPQWGWTSGSSTVVQRANTFSSSTGQLTAADTYDEANSNAKLLPTHIYSYGNLGTVTQEGDDVDGSGGLTDASIDRITKYSSIFYKDTSGYNGWVRQDVVSTLRTLNSATDITTLSDKRTRFTQFNGGAISGNARALSDVTSYDSSGRWYRDVTWADASANTQTSYHTEQGVSNTASKVWTNGYLSSEQSLTGVIKTYKYDAAGLMRSVTEGTTNDAMFYTYYPGTKYLESASRTTGTSTQATTSYTYSWDTSASTSTVSATDASLNVTNTESNALGLPWHVWGSAAQPTLYTYDTYGRRTGMTTWQTGSFTGSTWPSSPGTGNTVSWTPDPATGAITQKTYADGNHVDYTYNARGQLKTRTNRGSWLTTYNYFDSASALTGELQSVNYTGGSFATPNLSFTYKRFGAMATVNDASGSRSLDYNADLKPSTETLDGTYYGGKVLSSTYESGTARPTGYSFNGTSTLSQAGAYDPATGRMGTITGYFGTQSWAFTVGFNPGTDIVGTVSSGNYTRQIQLASGYDAINSVTTTWNGTTLGTFSALYGDARGLQSSLTSGAASSPAGSWSKVLGLGDGTAATFGYDSQGQLNSAPTPSWVSASGAQSLAARNFNWQFDLAGNRATEGGASSTSYTPGVNNQYTSITGANAESTLSYDSDGNMTADGSWSSYVYDHEDRLVSMSNGSTTMTYAYDYMGRRIRKTVTGTADTKFVWAGWTLVGDLNASDGATPLRGYVWGPDFTDARGLAGGAGALLAQTSAAGIAYAMPDQHGNIAGYLDSSGNLVAAREYSPFGKVINSYGAVASYPIGYSSKYTDSETGLVYYGKRYYNAKHGRFINRDPIDEKGGNNLYAMTQNRGVSGWDVLGCNSWETLRRLEAAGVSDSVLNVLRNIASAGEAMSRGWSTNYISSRESWDLDNRDFWVTAYSHGFDGFNAAADSMGIGSISDPRTQATITMAQATSTLYSAGRGRYVYGSDIHTGDNGTDTAKVGGRTYTLMAAGSGYVGIATDSSAVCFVAGTLISTVDNGFRPIEDIKVGQRVQSADDAASQQSDTEVDPATWRKVDLMISNADGEGNDMEITTLMPLSRIEQEKIEIGKTQQIDLKEMGIHALAKVVRISECPPIEPGHGRVVRTTYTRIAHNLYLLRVAGVAEAIKVTATHPLFSSDRKTWVPVGELRIGEHVWTASGPAAVESLEKQAKAERVFNFEVEQDHRYYVTRSRVLAHNQCAADSAAGKYGYIVAGGNASAHAVSSGVGTGHFFSGTISSDGSVVILDYGANGATSIIGNAEAITGTDAHGRIVGGVGTVQELNAWATRNSYSVYVTAAGPGDVSAANNYIYAVTQNPPTYSVVDQSTCVTINLAVISATSVASPLQMYSMLSGSSSEGATVRPDSSPGSALKWIQMTPGWQPLSSITPSQ